ncbi:MAG: 16S rRNA (adenine(1518)-N(6)/adenine(1519)-N(6))-dimethyltransferase RsmA [bacterium]|nr:16S rRNA (adenine(1518)-N(6)/adenine(1519)-N(6))-dimethyltransferase RsmA [bacterium]
MKIQAKKSLGQNFLINPHIIDKIVSAAEVSKDDIILEVGPGTGNLTMELAKKAKKVIAVEKDHRLIEYLREHLNNEHKNIEIIEGDILKMLPDHCSLNSCGYKIVANIPYYITSHFLRNILESADWRMAQPKLIVLTIQKEVAQRIIAKPPHMNLLALSVQYYSEPEIIGYISKNNFRPVPKVDSAIIRLNPKSEARNLKQTEEIFKVMRAGFSEKRKQLAPMLSKKLGINKDTVLEAFKKNELKETARAEELSLNQWQELAKIL